jgi:TRAP-type C4-dicarboxylate transport system permease small subunit
VSILRWLDDRLGWIEDALLAFATALLAVLLFANVLLRYVFRSPFAWMEEGIVAIFVWLVFIGVSAAFRSHQHLRIDVLVRFLPRPAAAAVGALAVAVTFAILGLLIWVGAEYARFVAGNRTPVLGISAAWLYVGLPLGMTLSVVHLVRQVVDEGPGDVLKSVIEADAEDVAAPAGAAR